MSSLAFSVVISPSCPKTAEEEEWGIPESWTDRPFSEPIAAPRCGNERLLPYVSSGYGLFLSDFFMGWFVKLATSRVAATGRIELWRDRRRTLFCRSIVKCAPPDLIKPSFPPIGSIIFASTSFDPIFECEWHAKIPPISTCLLIAWISDAHHMIIQAFLLDDFDRWFQMM